MANYTIVQVTNALEQQVPLNLAQAWDQVGLMSGAATWPCRRVLVTLDLTPAVATEAIKNKADLLVSYHPPIFRPVTRMTCAGNRPEQLVAQLLAQKIACYSPHTAFDAAPGGGADLLAMACGGTITGSFSYTVASATHLKLVTFVPATALEAVAEALFAAGCGHIGERSRYTRCSFRSPGTGTFQGDDSTSPAVGQRGRYEQVSEVRFETVLPKSQTAQVVTALQASHPYEEPAYDLIPLEAAPAAQGGGRLTRLAKPVAARSLAASIARQLDIPGVQVILPTQRVQRIAILPGSSGLSPLQELREPWDVLVTGELKHHDMLAYRAAGKAVICLGHWQSEKMIVPALTQLLRRLCPDLSVSASRAHRCPYEVL